MLTFAPKPITLTAYELILAAYAGCMRQVENMREGRAAKYAAAVENLCPTCGNKKKGAFQMHIEGCIGEAVLAKHLDVYWAGKGTFRGNDVGSGKQKLQARCSPGTDLVVHDDDKDDAMFYLVRWQPNTFLFHVSEGMLGRDAKQPQFWRERGVVYPAYFVPVDYSQQLKLT